MLADFDELVQTCRSDQSRRNIREAIQCWQAGAYRASIVCVWTAVLYDVIEKIFELAISGDSEARLVKEKFIKIQEAIDEGSPDAVKRALEFERDILATAKNKFSLLDAIKESDLLRIQVDRNRCAHPTYSDGLNVFAPTAELARTHIRHAVLHLLSQPPLQGKAAFDRINAGILSAYFPKEKDKAIETLRYLGINKSASLPLKLSLLDALIFGYFDPDSGHFDRRESIIALAALVECEHAAVGARFNTQFSKCMQQATDSELYLVFDFLFEIPVAQSLLEAPVVNRILKYLEPAANDENLSTLQAYFWDIPQFREKLEKRIPSMSIEEIGALFERKQFFAPLVERAIDLYTTQKSWVATNSVWQQALQLCVDVLDNVRVGRILDAVESYKGDILSSHSFRQLLQAIKSKPELAEYVSSRAKDANWERTWREVSA